MLSHCWDPDSREIRGGNSKGEESVDVVVCVYKVTAPPSRDPDIADSPQHSIGAE